MHRRSRRSTGSGDPSAEHTCHICDSDVLEEAAHVGTVYKTAVQDRTVVRQGGSGVVRAIECRMLALEQRVWPREACVETTDHGSMPVEQRSPGRLYANRHFLVS